MDVFVLLKADSKTRVKFRFWSFQYKNETIFHSVIGATSF